MSHLCCFTQLVDSSARQCCTTALTSWAPAVCGSFGGAGSCGWETLCASGFRRWSSLKQAPTLVRRAQHRAGLRRRRAATHPTHPIPPSLSCHTCGRFEKIDRRSRIGGLKPMGALRHDLHRAVSADAHGTEERSPGGRRSGCPGPAAASSPNGSGCDTLASGTGCVGGLGFTP